MDGTAVKSEPIPTREEILRAAEALAGAAGADGGGYNAVDFPVAKSVISSPGRTDHQIRTLWTLLRKYRDQLGRLGVDYDALVPPLPPRGPDGQFVLAANRIRLEWVETRHGRRIAIVFARNPKIEEALKSLRKTPASPPWFDHERKAWVMPEDFELLEQLVGGLKGGDPSAHVEISSALQEAAGRVKEAMARVYEASRAESSDIDVPTKIPLRPFQKAGVQWIEDRGGRALVGDEPGLGKTVQALGYLTRHPEALPALVVCPSTLKANWYQEVLRFTDLKPFIVSSKSSLKAYVGLGFDAALAPEKGRDVTIMNYDLLGAETPRSWVRDLCRGDQSVVPHLIKAGERALKQVKKAYEGAADIETKARLLKVIRAIEAKGGSPRKRYVRVSVNGTPLADFMAAGFKTLIIDESHCIKDAFAQRSIAVREISAKVRSVIALTGTPVLNRPRELWHQVKVVDPAVFPDFKVFGMRYCAGRTEEVQVKGAKKGETREVLDFSGASNLEELDREIRSRVMIRRLKSQVLKELPDKIRITIPIVAEKGLDGYRKAARPAIERLAAVKRERDEWRRRIASMPPDERSAYLAAHAEEAASKGRLANVAIEEIEKLKLAAASLKLPDSVRFVLDAREQQGKVVVFVSHHETLDRMAAGLRDGGLKVGWIDGRLPGPERGPVKDAFQEGDTDVLVCGIRAASEGLTLTASHTVVFVEYDWSPARHEQASDRCHRIGQTVAPTIYYLMAVGTIEEAIIRLIESKREVVNAALGEGDRTFEEMGILDAILDDIAVPDGGDPNLGAGDRPRQPERKGEEPTT